MPAGQTSCFLALSFGAFQELRELLRRHRLAVEEALHLVATVALEKMQLRIGLDALGDHLQVQRMAERDDGRAERSTEPTPGLSPASSQARVWRAASYATHSPSWTMRPVSSAIGMKRAGRTRPHSGCIQRTSASAPMIEPERRSTFCW